MIDHSRRPLFDALIAYSKSNVTPFDVPGHKMGKGIHQDFIDYVGENIFKMDINSLKEMDNLSNPEGVIKEAEMLAADLFDSDHAFFLVNGSTSGVQNMILSAMNPGEKIIIPRNIHKSAINGLVLSGAVPIYIYPEICTEVGISVGTSVHETIQAIDNNPDAKALLLLNPTYYGFSTNLKKIIDYAHKHNVIVLVDESHGTHFYLDDAFPDSAMTLGADMATLSIHKTGGSLTQSSVLLHNDGRIPVSRVRSVINISQTSSASYLLMASLDIARHALATNKELINNVIRLSQIAKNEINQIPNLRIVDDANVWVEDEYTHDSSKLLVDVSRLGKTGFEIYELLKEDYNIQLEFGEALVVLAIISVGDTVESVLKLIAAFQDLSKRFKDDQRIRIPENTKQKPAIKKTPREAFFAETEYIDITTSEGRISGDQIMIYPPGIPLLVPGEVISKDVISEYLKYIEYGKKVVGSYQNGNIQIKVTKET